MNAHTSRHGARRPQVSGRCCSSVGRSGRCGRIRRGRARRSSSSSGTTHSSLKYGDVEVGLSRGLDTALSALVWMSACLGLTIRYEYALRAPAFSFPLSLYPSRRCLSSPALSLSLAVTHTTVLLPIDVRTHLVYQTFSLSADPRSPALRSLHLHISYHTPTRLTLFSHSTRYGCRCITVHRWRSGYVHAADAFVPWPFHPGFRLTLPRARPFLPPVLVLVGPRSCSVCAGPRSAYSVYSLPIYWFSYGNESSQSNKLVSLSRFGKVVVISSFEVRHRTSIPKQ